VEFVQTQSEKIAATITPHHLQFNRNDLLAGGVRPHFYCLPILKRNQHQRSLIEAAISGNPKFFLGTDSAPHSQASKETSCGCAGIYSAPSAIEHYAQTFDECSALEKLEAFASFFGADFYGLPRNQSRITLSKHNQHIPESFPLGDEIVVPMRAGETIAWSAGEINQ